MSKSDETYLHLPPRCFVKGCARTFEGQMPEDWLKTSCSFVATVFDDTRRPVKLVPIRAEPFFCPEHADQIAQIENLGDVTEPTPEGGFTINLDDD